MPQPEKPSSVATPAPVSEIDIDTLQECEVVKRLLSEFHQDPLLKFAIRALLKLEYNPDEKTIQEFFKLLNITNQVVPTGSFKERKNAYAASLNRWKTLPTYKDDITSVINAFLGWQKKEKAEDPNNMITQTKAAAARIQRLIIYFDANKVGWKKTLDEAIKQYGRFRVWKEPPPRNQWIQRDLARLEGKAFDLCRAKDKDRLDVAVFSSEDSEELEDLLLSNPQLLTPALRDKA